YCFIILLFLTILSCNKDIEDITVEGMVKSSETQEALKNVDVTVICWKYGNSPDQSYSEDETKTVTTDSEGKYKVAFDKGAYVEVKINLEGYNEAHETKDIYQKKNTVNISLTK